MGCVYLGVDDAGSRVAIKVLSMQTQDALDRFRAEARAVSLISHVNIVNLVDVAELPDGRPYMVMELVEGQSLRDAAPLMEAAAIARVCSEVLAALDAAHAIGIVHRDLKPDNIMVTKAGHAKVLDFGVAKLAPGVGGGLTPRTAEGLTMGTPAYMAPEQVVGGAVDARTDVYTMGVVLFEALTGKRPFAGSDVEVMRAHRDREPPRPRSLVPTIPVAVEEVILRALAKDPRKRFPSAHEMATALVNAATGRVPAKETPPTVRAIPAAAAAPARAPSRVPALIAVAAIAVAATVVFVVARSRRNAHHAPSDVPSDADAQIDDAASDPLPVLDALSSPDAALADAAPDAALADAAIAERRDASETVAPAALPPPVTRSADFAVKAFDPLGYIPRATEHARALAPDAALVDLTVTPIDARNLIDLSRPRPNLQYRFFTATGAGAPKVAGERPCLVVVRVTASGSRTSIEMDPRCAQKPVAMPRCSIARLRELVHSAYGVDSGTTADLMLTYRGRWFLQATLDGEPARMELPDC